MSRPESIVSRIAAQIRKEALAAADGELLGSEDALLARYQISRPTFRQASSLIAQEQLITVKRGVGGGYFARRPDSRAVSRVAAVYLKAHGARVSDILGAFAPIRTELARLASRATDEKLTVLSEFLNQEAELTNCCLFRDFLVSERQFNTLLGKISGNQALSLYLQITLDLAAMVEREEDMYRDKPDRIASMRQERNRMAEAILNKDEELAVLSAQRCGRLSVKWLEEDAGHHRTHYPHKKEANFSEVHIR